VFSKNMIRIGVAWLGFTIVISFLLLVSPIAARKHVTTGMRYYPVTRRASQVHAATPTHSAITKVKINGVDALVTTSVTIQK
jgi:hypothetical protein